MITVPCLTLLPIAGVMLFTLPEPLTLTFNPRFSRSTLASFLFLPSTFGTNTNSDPFEMTNSILLPLLIRSDFSGVWVIT